MDDSEILQTLIQIANEAGAILMEGWESRPKTESKAALHDLVTAFDRRSEVLVLERLKRAFPECAVVGEEGGRVEQAAGAPVFYVDPLDGTINFTHGLPLFAVSIGLVKDGVPTLGVVHAPALGFTFSGAVGLGAFRNGRALSVSAAQRVQEALVVTGFPSTRPEPNENIPEFTALNSSSRGTRRLGSAALDLAFVAAGWLDGAWERRLSPWDVAGGAALVAAAGGRVTDLDGGLLDVKNGRVLATNGLIHHELCEQLRGVALQTGSVWP
ncbi:MAG: inositol monophosphatase family protein [Polyangiaceae bacterium]|nr:inositol monophosphatase family protein [Polyangiaceae bacterium]